MRPLTIANIYRDFFITFGGLISSKTLIPELDRNHAIPTVRKGLPSLKNVFSGQNSEPQIQRAVKNWLQEEFGGTGLNIATYSDRKDVILSGLNDVILEFKHNRNDVPLDDLPGSPAELTAVQQLFKYLLTSEANIGVLTDGKSFRFYYLSSREKPKKQLSKHEIIEISKMYTFAPYIEFAVQDIVLMNRPKHFELFVNLLLDQNYLKNLMNQSEDQGHANESKFEKTLSHSLVTLRDKYPDKFEDIAVLVSTVGAIRVLEDHGVFPDHPNVANSGKFRRDYLLRDSEFDKQRIARAINGFLNGKFLKIEGGEFGTIRSHSGDEVLNAHTSCRSALEELASSKVFKEIMQLLLTYDFSDLPWTFWSMLYQINANRGHSSKDIGRYYTHPRITQEIIEWFTQQELRSTKGDDGLPIYDPCVGSGNMLRTFLGFAHKLGKSNESPIEPAQRAVKERLWGSDIDRVALWICKLSLSTAVAARGSLNRATKLCQPKVFHMDVFDESGWRQIIRGGKKFNIVSNPPWKRPKFQINYAFRDIFELQILPKVETSLYGPYEAFKEIVTFGFKGSQAYYKLWEDFANEAVVNLTNRATFVEFEEKWKLWKARANVRKELGNFSFSFRQVLCELHRKKTEIDGEKARYRVFDANNFGDEAETTLKDKSCAGMFFERMVKALPKYSKFAIVQPDSFFVGDSEERRSQMSEIKHYFCFSKNRIPGTKKPLFSEVHTGMRFGVVLGIKGHRSSEIKCSIFKTDLPKEEIADSNDDIEVLQIKLNKAIQHRMRGFGMLPIFDSLESYRSLLKWIKYNDPLTTDYRWRVGIDKSESRRWMDGQTTQVASSKALVSVGDSFQYRIRDAIGHEKRILPDNVRVNMKVREQRVFVADVNRSAPSRHSCLLTGIIPEGKAVFNNILWFAPRDARAMLKKINTELFEAALYCICKSTNINGMALNWLGFGKRRAG